MYAGNSNLLRRANVLLRPEGNFGHSKDCHIARAGNADDNSYYGEPVKCIAFAPTKFAEFWMPCTNAAAPFDKFCRMHRDAIDGVFLGLQNQGNFKALGDLMDEFG